jgi:hypothetical protein
MRNIILGGLVATAALGAVPASATVVTFTNGVYTGPGYATSTSTRDFNSAVNTPPIPGAPNGQYIGGSNELVSGNVFAANGSATNVNVNPDGGSDRYLAIQGGSYTLLFGAPIQFLSFIIGSVDSYNSLQLNFSDGSTQSFSGLQITTGSTASSVGSFNSAISGRVTYDFQGGAGLLSAVFSSTQPTLEIDDIVTAVPEPAAWSLMILGFGLVGSQLRTRRRKTTVAFAA